MSYSKEHVHLNIYMFHCYWVKYLCVKSVVVLKATVAFLFCPLCVLLMTKNKALTYHPIINGLQFPSSLSPIVALYF